MLWAAATVAFILQTATQQRDAEDAALKATADKLRTETNASPVIQAGIAESRGDNYGLALAVVIGIVAVVLAGLSFFGPEKKGVQFGGGDAG